MREPIEMQVAAARAREAAVPDDARLPRLDRSAWAPGTRWCASCQSMPPTFYFPSGGSQCRACASAARHAASIRKEYDLSAEEYDALLLLQNGVCAICARPPKTQRLAVDHDHSTGRVRGLLHSTCNHDLLGGAHDNLDMLRSAVHYMEHPPTSGDWMGPRVKPRTPSKGARTDPAPTDPTYLMFDHDAASRSLPEVLERVAKRMTVDELVFSGGKSDPDTGTYWLAYRKAAEETPPF